MKERVPRNGVPDFEERERNGREKFLRNEERNGVPLRERVEFVPPVPPVPAGFLWDLE